MQDKKFLILGKVKNRSKTLFNKVSCFKKAFSKSLKYQFLLVESDRTDKLLQILRNLKKKRKDFNFESCDFFTYNLLNRTKGISYYKNKYLNYLFKNSIYKWADYFGVAAFDGVCSSLNERYLLSFCEHVIFNNFMTSIGGIININPQLIIGKSSTEYFLRRKQAFYFCKKIKPNFKK
tara:strand:- start:134 stop:667 length:534 start_codon:yes stop_codon:yes gene_type:complete